MKLLLIAVLCFAASAQAFTNLGDYEGVNFPVADIDKSIKFYEKLGYKLQDREDRGYAIMKRASKNAPLDEVILVSNEFRKVPSINYETKNIKALKAELIAAKIKIEIDGTDSTLDKTLTFRDLDGHVIFVSQCVEDCK